MRYTLWSRGRLLGETDLEFIYREDGFRCGWLHPSALGDRLMPTATGVGPALRTLCIIGPDATARADAATAADQEEALELQLRGPRGAVIATETIAVIDTHYLLSIPNSDLGDKNPVDADQEPGMDEMLETWTTYRDHVSVERYSLDAMEFPRYQIQVRLSIACVDSRTRKPNDV